MPNYFQRPENALKRANEFIDVGKKQPALDALYDVIKSKKHRTWQKIHEPIMEKYLELCVELRKSHTAKEGLYQYKNICQQVNVRSLEDVVRKYLMLAETKTEEARKKSVDSVLEIDDLENLITPEDLLLSAVSGEDTQARTDRVMLIPWVKFLWESYRQCLDLLRNNNRVEKLYQDIACDAFRFCQKYQRKTEFRKLCDNLRNHLGLIQKHQNQTTAINLNNPESQQMHLDTRLFQLDTAITMELWQEAYKAVEDIHSLMSLSKKSPKPQMMANYYQKLGLVFWKSGNALFHACALHRLLQLSREQRKNMPEEEIKRMASRVLLATLAIPISPPRNDIGDMLDMGNTNMDNQRKLANLLGLQAPSNRVQLVKDLMKYNVIPYAKPQVRDLFTWLEVKFHPLHLCDRVTVVLDSLKETDEPELMQYIPALQNNTVMRLLKQVSQVYESIQFSRLIKLVPFVNPFYLERMVVDASRNGAVQVRLDHSTMTLVFGGPLTVSQKDEQQEEGPRIQDLPSDQIRNQLCLMSNVLHRATKLIQPMHMKEERLNEKQLIIQSYRRTQRKEHERILQRRHIIEDRKEKLETISNQREKAEQDQIEHARNSQRDAENKRLEREAAERTRKKQQEEIEEIQKRHAQERIKTLKQSAIGQKVFLKLKEEELSKMDADEIMAKHVEQLEAEKKELQARLRSQEKKIDHFARAKRIEEIPLLKAEYEENSVEDRKLWDVMEEERIIQLKAERELALKTRDQLARMTKDKDEFINTLKQSRMNLYKASLVEFQDKVHETRTQRMADRKVKRKEERRKKWLEEKEEKEQIRKDEEAKRLREEARLAEEEEYAERARQLEEQEAKKAARMREIEERLQREKEEGRRGRDDRNRDDRGRDDRGRDDRPPGDSDNWRRRDEPRRDVGRDEPRRDVGRDNEDWGRGGGRRDNQEGERRRDNQEGERRRDNQEGDKPSDGPSAPWRPKPKEGGWRDREKKREDSWRRSRDEPDIEGEGDPERRDGEERPVRQEERRPERSRFASRDIRLDEEGSGLTRPVARDMRLDEDPSLRKDDGNRDIRRNVQDREIRRDDGDRDVRREDQEPPRDDRRRDVGGPRRDFDRGGDRGGRDFGGDRDSGRRDLGGRDRDFGRGEKEEGDSWRRDRGPPREEQREWRRDGGRDSGPPEGEREWRRGPPRDSGPPGDRDDWGRRGDGPRRDLGDRDRGGGRDLGDRDRGSGRDFGGRGGGRDRDFGGRDMGGRDRDMGGRDRDFGRDREPPSDGGGAWRRGGLSRGGPPRDRDGPPSRDRDGPPPRDRDGPPPRDRDGPPSRDRDGPPRDGPPPIKREAPPPEREAPPPRDREVPPPKREEPAPAKQPSNVEDDGWETVVKRR